MQFTNYLTIITYFTQFTTAFLSNPQPSRTRTLYPLPDFWEFSIDNQKTWDITAVPSSFNDLGTTRDFHYPPDFVYYSAFKNFVRLRMLVILWVFSLEGNFEKSIFWPKISL